MNRYIVFILLAVMLHLNLSSSLLDGETTLTLFITPSSSMPCSVKPCLTLSQFAQNSSSWLSLNTTLIFLAGNHTLNTKLSISNISKLYMLTNFTFSLRGTHVISCKPRVSFNFENITKVWIKGLKFIGCGSNTFSLIKNFTIENSTFQGQNNSGTALDTTETNLTIVNSLFVSNRIGRCLIIFDSSTTSNRSIRAGGAIFVAKSNLSIIKCTFVNNSAEVGGAMYSTSYELNNISISNSIFVSNRAAISSNHIQVCNYPSILATSGSIGGAIAIFTTTLIIKNSTFTNNTSEAGDGGALSIQQRSVTHIHSSEFCGNSAKSYGGALFIVESHNNTINSSKFLNNSATKGGVVYSIQGSMIATTESIFGWNSAKLSGGVMSLDQETRLQDNHSLFIHNRATTGGVLYHVRSGLTLQDSIFSLNQATESGGAMYILQNKREVIFSGYCNLTHNSAGTGGAIYAIDSTLLIAPGYTSLSTIIMIIRLSLAYNEARDSGGGIYLYRSILFSLIPLGSIVNISSNKAANNGGGIHAINSLITCMESYRRLNNWPYQNLMIFANNSAQKGGGLYLESAAQLRLEKVNDFLNPRKIKLNTSIYFTSNIAEYGAAIYVADETYFDVCRGRYSVIKSTATSNAECFVQVFSSSLALAAESSAANIEFTTNDDENYTVIFGGLLDRCIPDPRRAEILHTGPVSKEIDGFTYLKLISNIVDSKQISSLPVRVCFCTPDGNPSCSYEPPTIHVKKGESFNLTLVAVDQVNHTISNITIHSSLNHTESSLGEDQSTQVTNEDCTNLIFSIYSPHISEVLILYAEGPCRNAERSQSRVLVTFQLCTCPIGFQPNYETNDCVCVCDSRLSPYFTEPDNNCNIQTESLIRRGTAWTTFIDDSNRYHNSSGFLIYPYCPLDYCLPPTSSVHINLNRVDGADAQCANNRSGLLCSLCQPSLSLSYGSSRCISCSKTWYKGYVPVVLITMVAGILLVVLLMTLNLTVAIGTLNGLIFYANIIGANKSTFFSGLSPLTKFYSVLISWLNLEVGFDVCFFEGMDTYWKTWLQLAFPTYVIFLVAITIIVSEHSMRFSRLIARRNPVATLATLILLSYTKFLQTTITTLSLANLDYPDGSNKRVWLSDATIEYLSRKHIPLFTVAVVILVLGITYTCLIFFWQWLLRYQVFKWTNSQRLYHFFEPYHAPYVSKHRYWTGLLLFMRIALYLVFALNVSGDPGINLLAINTSVISLLVIKGQLGRVYKSTFVDMTEMACYTNLCVFSAIRLKFGDKKIVDISTHISGVVTLLLLIVMISYHVYTMFCSKCSKRCQHSTERQVDDSEPANCNTIDALSTENHRSEPTSSVVELNLPVGGRKHPVTTESSQLSRITNETSDDNISLISADSTTPFVYDCD